MALGDVQQNMISVSMFYGLIERGVRQCVACWRQRSPLFRWELARGGMATANLLIPNTVSTLPPAPSAIKGIGAK